MFKSSLNTGLAKSSSGFFHKLVQKIPNQPFGQLITNGGSGSFYFLVPFSPVVTFYGLKKKYVAILGQSIDSFQFLYKTHKAQTIL